MQTLVLEPGRRKPRGMYRYGFMTCFSGLWNVVLCILWHYLCCSLWLSQVLLTASLSCCLIVTPNYPWYQQLLPEIDPQFHGCLHTWTRVCSEVTMIFTSNGPMADLLERDRIFACNPEIRIWLIVLRKKVLFHFILFPSLECKAFLWPQGVTNLLWFISA